MNLPRTTICRLLLFCVFVAIPPTFSADPTPRPALLARMEKVMGSFPTPAQRCDLDIQVTETVQLDKYTRHFLTYQSEPGARVPAYVLVPDPPLAQPKPFGILTLHQTHALGQKVVVGLGNSTNDEYAVELVQRGFVCIAPAYPHLANYAPSLTNYQSGTMKAIWDNVRALDVLTEKYGCDPRRFASIGHSLGGHNGLYTAAFDQRIKVVVTSCGFDSFRDYMNGNIKGWTSPRYMPKLLDYAPDRYPFDFDTVLAAISPRAIYINAPKGDTNFKWESVARLVAQARANLPQTNIRLEHPDAPHIFPKEIRARAYEFIAETLATSPLR